MPANFTFGNCAREPLEVGPEDEADADHEVDAARRQRAQRALAIRALGRLDVLDVCTPSSALRALEPATRRFVERLVVLAADVEHEADAHARPCAAWRFARTTHRTDADERDVERDQDGDQPAG